MHHIVYVRGEGLSLVSGACPEYWNSSSVVLYSSPHKAEALMVLDEYQEDLEPGILSKRQMGRKFREMRWQAEAVVVREKDFTYHTFTLGSGWQETFTCTATTWERGVKFAGVCISHQTAFC